jgi:hypothetical protein
MDKGLLHKYTGRRDDEPEGSAPVEPDAPEDLGAFGYLRGIRDRCTMLELRRKTGDILAVGYGWLERAEFDASEGITLHLGARAVRITGRNLNAEVRPMVRLYEGIVRHRVPWLREANETEVIQTGTDVCIIESINW